MSPRWRRPLLTVLMLAALCLAATAPGWAQCAMCQTALTGSPEGREMTGHLNHAILIMFFAPYLVLGSFLLLLFHRQIRRGVEARLVQARARVPGLWPARIQLR